MAVRSISATSYFAGLTRYSIYALLIFTPLARASVQDWAVTIIHMVTLIALTAFLLERCLSWEWIRTPLDMPIICLLALCVLSSIFSLHKVASLWAFILLFNYLVIYYLVIHTIRTRAQFMQLVWLIILIGAFLAIFGFYKKHMGNPFPWWNYHNIPENAGHLISTFGNRNHLAGYLEMAVFLSFGLLMTGIRGAKRYILISLTILLFVTLLFALSRGGWAGGFFGLLFMAFVLLTSHRFYKKRLVVAMGAGALALMVFVLSSTTLVTRILSIKPAGETGSLAGRIKVWGGVVKMIEDHPFLGVGPGNFATVVTQYLPPAENRHFFAHNEYLQSVAEIGLASIVIMAWLIAATYRRGFKKLRNFSRLVRGTTVGALSGITAILVHNIIDFNLHIPANALVFTVLVALVVSPVPIDNQKSVHLGESHSG